MPPSTEEDRFIALLEEHKGIVYRVVRSYARGAADRADLEQEIVVQLWRSFPRFDPALRFSTWAYRIALNVAISALRREARHTRHRVHDEAAVLQVVAPAAEADERLDALYARLQTLGDMDRALVLLHLDGHRHEGIAEILGISASNVGTRLGRIKAQLRRDLAPTT